MSTIQSLKNFIRHGKQARLVTPHAEPTTDVSPIHVQQQRQPQGKYQAAAGNLDALDTRHGSSQTTSQGAPDTQPKVSRADIEQLVAEERQSRSKMPKYPGLERWMLLEKMGDGAFSNVYRARDMTGQMDEVAIKVVRKFEMNKNQDGEHVHPQFREKPKGVERANILKEVQIMRQLDHPNIVKLIDFSESPQYYYIILELCPGGELFHQIVRLTYFSEELSRHVIIQVAEAIKYLHEHSGVVHRDIKPENLLFYPIAFVPSKNPKAHQPGDEDKVDEGEFIVGVGAGSIGQIKIADFGLSKVIWDSQTMTPCGTVGYTAPEIVKDERYSKGVDMWALGCVLYTLLCGFPPFYDESIQTLTEKVARGQYTFLSPWWDDISKSAQDLVSHLLTVDPGKRYTITEFLDHPWIRQTDEETHAATDAPPRATLLKENIVRSKGAEQALHPLSPFLDQLPPATGRRMDFRSPGAVNLREVFDVGYAVHRQEEEGRGRKNARQGFRGANPSTGFRASLNALNDYDDDYDDLVYYNPDSDVDNLPSRLPKPPQQAGDVAAMEAKLRLTNLGAQASSAAQARQTAASIPRRNQQQGYGQHSATVAAAARQTAARRARQPFELNMDNATLLGRRERRQKGLEVA